MEIVEVADIDTSFTVRPVTESGVAMVQAKIETLGYMEEKPIVVDDNMVLICGHHRVNALKNLNITEVPAIVKTGLSDFEMKKLAFNSNESEGASPVTFVDYAHFIWGEDGTQEEIAGILGWGQSKVAGYIALQNITTSAWDVITESVGAVIENITTVIFTENLIRPIIKLEPEQQMDLVEGLSTERYNKKSFKKKAELYKQINKDLATMAGQIEKIVSAEIFDSVVEEIMSGTYDINLLIQKAIDEHNKKTSVTILNCDCLDGLKDLEDESIDLIATDPPYNMDKAEWDSYGNGEQFSEWCMSWLVECKRVLKPSGSIYIFGINRMLSHLQKWLDDNMVYRNWITWDTIQGAGGGLWVNRKEEILYYSKTNDTYEDRTKVQLERHEENVREYKGKTYKFKNPSNIWRFPCVDDKSEERTEHITQKPVAIMERIVKANCPVGGIVCDPFMGSGTTAIASYRHGMKAIGFEKDKVNFKMAGERVKNEISG